MDSKMILIFKINIFFNSDVLHKKINIFLKENWYV